MRGSGISWRAGDLLYLMPGPQVVTARAPAEFEDLRPGLLDAVAGPVIFQDRPDAAFDEHLGKVDDQISRLIVWARQYRGELP